ncbi:DUF4411 family protein [Sedimenticola selenatireducens]|jgi:hypothetical protein|uniref:DUF4411 family protein n=1 Tax=Sedimenticola selenatireducens TaxID=191960 RepID=A0A557SCT8_9GAMM|nr:DUF4411 family protein [Sedimenticola selenatireducens]TVO75235.1 DUF4411 family protein [Sedimenticola selenatireducens]TVT66912.1 MAG: DUF4411 family protein [Sedimenticola selenatireducens]
MLYLIDSNVLITAKNYYYEMDRVPEFWDWLIHQGQQGAVKIPFHIYNEPKSGADELSAWLKQTQVIEALLLNEEVDGDLLQYTIDKGYAPDLTDVELAKVGMDPFLIAHALADIHNRTVVSIEASKPKAQRANRRIPDICHSLGVSHIGTFELARMLNFSTSWKK